MKKKNLKRSLLLSILSLLLCVSTFVGTTFAWFSETITNQKNKIMAGNLDVELYYMTEGMADWAEVTETTVIFPENALWEPGYTQVVYFKVANEGTLALKYQFGLSVLSETTGTNVAGETFKLSDYIKFGVVEGATYAPFADRADAIAKVDANAKKISEGFTKASSLVAGTATAPSEEYVAMTVYMPETVGNEANYKTGTAAPVINLGIELYATQMMNEEDSFGPDYDEDAKLPATKTEDVVAGNDTVIETENGSVSVPAGATTAEKLTYSVAPTTAPGTITVAAGETLTAYEVELLDENGDKVTTTAPVEASIYVGKGLNVTKLYHNDTAIPFDYNTVTGYITFSTDSFSPFTVVTKAAADLEVITTADALVAAAAKGGAYQLGADIQLSSILVVSKGFTLYGNNKTLTSTATRAINVSGANGVVIKDLTINASGERAVNVIQNATNVVLDNVTATAANYTVNLAGSAPNAVVTVKNSNLTGLNVVNVGAAGAEVTVTDSTINCNDNNTTAGEVYAALCLNKDAVGASIIATDTTVNVTAGSDSEKGRNGAEDGTVTINGSTEGVAVTVAAITYPGSDYYYGFTSLAEAIEFAKAGDTITLIRDVSLSDILVIEKAVTLDGNGKTLTSTAARAINVDTTGKVVINDLIINAGERAINIINKVSTVELNDVTATAKNNAVMIATSAGAVKLTINNSVLTGLAVVNVAGANAQVEINNTTITNKDANSSETYGAITIWSSAAGADVVVNGGDINVADDSHEAFVFPADATIEGVEDVDYVVATVGAGGFTTLKGAIDYAKAGDTITILRDIVLTETVEIPEGKKLTLDLNGKTIIAPAGAICAIQNKGTLTVKGAGTIAGSYTALYSNGNLTIENGNFTATDGFGVLIDNIYGTEASVAVINGGTFTGIGIYNPTDVTINGGTFNVGRDPDGASWMSEQMTLFISPTFVGAPNTAKVTLNGGTFNGDVYVYDDGITETVFVNNGATITGSVLDNN